MDKLLEMATIIIKHKMQGTFLAQVTLDWQQAFEVRYFRIMLSRAGNLWLQSPATGWRNESWAKCFIVKDTKQWHKLQEKVIKQFLEEIDQKIQEGVYSRNILEILKNSSNSESITEEDLDKIDEAITHSNL